MRRGERACSGVWCIAATCSSQAKEKKEEKLTFWALRRLVLISGHLPGAGGPHNGGGESQVGKERKEKKGKKDKKKSREEKRKSEGGEEGSKKRKSGDGDKEKKSKKSKTK